MSRYKKGELDSTQASFGLESYDDKIAQDNPVRVIDAFIDSLDMVVLRFIHTITK